MLSLYNSLVRFILALVVTCVALAFGVQYLNEASIRSITHAEAQEFSEVVARRFVLEVPNLDRALNSAKPDKESLNQLRRIAMNSGAVRFKLFNREGNSVLRFDRKGQDPEPDKPLGVHNPSVLNSIQDGKTRAVFKEARETSDPEGVTRLLVETYVPIANRGKIVGLASVYIDQTDIAARLRTQLSRLNFIIVALTLLAFAVPAVLAYFQTRKKIKADQQVAYLAQFDVLTNLLNRKTFESRLNASLEAARTAGQRLTIHFIDLDHFKSINDNYGHAFGDELLKQFASNLKSLLQPDDIAARFGGDEFVIVQTGMNSIEDVARATRRLVEATARPMEIFGKPIVLGASTGTAIFPESGQDKETLLRCADIALYVVKGNGRNGHRFYEPAYEEIRKRRGEVERLIRKNVASMNFILWYQPIYSLKARSLHGFEALIRMQDEQGNFISPAEFIPVAEDLGLINEIGAWALSEACGFARTWPKGIKVSVNLSSVQFRKKTACSSVLDALKRSELPPEQLIVEITESVLLADIDEVRQQIDMLNTYGVELAMDDFGTGYSSLSNILRLPFDRLKIDKSFVSQMSTGDANALKLVDTIISLGQTLNMSVTAEGVETAEQLQKLHQLGCDHVQGFYFSKPVAPAEVSNLIMKSFVETIMPAEEPALEGAGIARIA